MGAHALDFDVDGWQGAFSTTVSLGSSWRAESQDKRLVFGANSPGGTAGERLDAKNLNWDKGDRFTTPLKAVFDLSVRKNDAGAFVRAKAWYDQALEDASVRYGSANTGYRPGNLSDSGQPALNKFKGVALLDAYVYDTFDVAQHPLQVRLGKQVVNWGESLFIQGIWHETYRIRAGDYEAIYSGMPPFGLGQAGVQSAVTEANEAARQRLG